MADGTVDGFDHKSNADETRQAQHSRSNDSPTDVNNNAILARAQGATTELAGKMFADRMDRRGIIADQMMQKP